MTNKSLGRTRLVIVAMLLVVGLLAMAGAGWAAEKSPLEGKNAPDFTLKDVLQGQDYSLSQFKGKVVMINFFTFTCGPCREEMPDLNKIYQENKDKGFVTLGIALSSDPTQIRFLVKSLGLTYPVLTGTDQVGKAYGDVAVVPTTFIIDKQGKVVNQILGTRKKEQFEKMIQALM
ncbi:MAG: TlpA disulfide reductase family protein [Deltaproteobacteria bacterium]|nr:TlpA disulfide reductase family protein [Deltaproteobacteria bacterium]